MKLDLAPRPAVSEAEMKSSVPWIVRDATLYEITNTLTSGTLLCAFAVSLGASNTVVGLVAGIAPLMQLAQLAATELVDRTRLRKTIAFAAAVLSRALWLGVAAVALLPAGRGRMSLLVGVLALRGATNAFYICASNSWMRDLIPDKVMGDFYAGRMRASYVAALLTGLGGGLLVDLSSQGRLLGSAGAAYAALFCAATVSGELAALAMLRVPEPAMPPRTNERLMQRLAKPLANANYRKFLRYLAAWNLTAGMAAPLETLFLLRRLGYPLSWIVVLEAGGKITHLLTLGAWGRLADRHGSRAVVAAAQPLYWASLLLWPVAAFMGHGRFTLVFIGGIYVLNRAASAGINIGNNTLGMQLAPKGGATAYLALRSLVMNPVTFVAPLLAGVMADQLGRIPALTAPGALVGPLDIVLFFAALVGLVSAWELRGLAQAGTTPGRVRAELFATLVPSRARFAAFVARLRTRAAADPELAPHLESIAAPRSMP